MTISDDRCRVATLPPRALIVTIYGLCARDTCGWLSVSGLIRLLTELGVDEPAVRSSISRLKRREILEAQRVRGVAGYALSPQARGLLEEGDHRIFERHQAILADGWLLAVFSVPESERRQRHVLRSRLALLGFGTVSAGVWVAPAHLEAGTRDALERQGLTAYIDLFHADHLAYGEVADHVGTWWDLDGLRTAYDDFVVTYAAVLAAWKRRRSVDDAQAFSDYVRALTAWRRLSYLDPGLPEEVLPADWSGASAAHLFDTLRQRLGDPATAFAAGVTTVR